MERVAHYISERVMQFSEHLEKKKYMLHTEVKTKDVTNVLESALNCQFCQFNTVRNEHTMNYCGLKLCAHVHAHSKSRLL